MQSQNNNIEDLVRQAAEFNPVKAKGADWEAVFNKLAGKGDAVVRAEAKSKKYLFLLLFLLSSLLCNEFYYLLYNKQSIGITSGITDNINKKSNVNDNTKVESDHLTKKAPQKLIYQVGRTVKNYSIPAYLAPASTAVVSVDKSIPLITDIKKDDVNYKSDEPAFKDNDKEVFTQDYEKDENIIINKNIEEDKEVQDKMIPVKAERVKQKRFYAAFLLGPDISTVQFSEIKAVGHSIGIAAGFALSKRFSVETGVFLDQKKYVAEGEYFKAEKLYLPDHSKLLNVSGYCNMIEIPFNIRYNIATKNNYNLFGMAGLSSYLVQKEDYDYQYSRYNNLYSNSKSYNEASIALFNVVNLSAGFEKRVGKTTALRIEPYVKLPVRSMGVGNMRLSSAGVLVGIRYPF